MTAAAPPVESRRSSLFAPLLEVVRRDTWLSGLVGLFVPLVIFTKIINPSYGSTGIQGLALSGYRSSSPQLPRPSW